MNKLVFGSNVYHITEGIGNIVAVFMNKYVIVDVRGVWHIFDVDSFGTELFFSKKDVDKVLSKPSYKKIKYLTQKFKDNICIILDKFDDINKSVIMLEGSINKQIGNINEMKELDIKAEYIKFRTKVYEIFNNSYEEDESYDRNDLTPIIEKIENIVTKIDFSIWFELEDIWLFGSSTLHRNVIRKECKDLFNSIGNIMTRTGLLQSSEFIDHLKTKNFDISMRKVYEVLSVERYKECKERDLELLNEILEILKLDELNTNSLKQYTVSFAKIVKSYISLLQPITPSETACNIKKIMLKTETFYSFIIDDILKRIESVYEQVDFSESVDDNTSDLSIQAEREVERLIEFYRVHIKDCIKTIKTPINLKEITNKDSLLWLRGQAGFSDEIIFETTLMKIEALERELKKIDIVE